MVQCPLRSHVDMKLVPRNRKSVCVNQYNHDDNVSSLNIMLLNKDEIIIGLGVSVHRPIYP